MAHWRTLGIFSGIAFDLHRLASEKTHYNRRCVDCRIRKLHARRSSRWRTRFRTDVEPTLHDVYLGPTFGTYLKTFSAKGNKRCTGTESSLPPVTSDITPISKMKMRRSASYGPSAANGLSCFINVTTDDRKSYTAIATQFAYEIAFIDMRHIH